VIPQPTNPLRISTLPRLALAVLFALAVSWGGQVLHLVLVPHHYCLAHDDYSHESMEVVSVHQHDGASDNHKIESPGLRPEVTSPHQHEHCSVVGTSLRKFSLNANVQGEIAFAYGTDSPLPLQDFIFAVPATYRLAPKNSPPHV